jgi:kynurenine formamidase
MSKLPKNISKDTRGQDIPIDNILKNFNFIDLTHALSSEIPNWSGTCGFQYKVKHDYSDSVADVKFRVHEVEMHSGIGTHMDAPAHCIQGGLAIADISLENLIIPCSVIDVSKKAHEKYSVTTEDIIIHENDYGKILPNTFVIVYTGWERFWNQPEKYRNELVFPSISRQAAELLLDRDIVGLGIDTLSPDRADDDFPVHQLILGAGKYIIENVANAKNLPPVGAYVCVLPIKIKEGTEAPVRLIGFHSPTLHGE